VVSTPRKPSGSANRKRKRLEAEEAKLRVTKPDRLMWDAKFATIGEPPMDGAGRVEWANRIGALALYESIVAPLVRPAGERKQILDGIRTLGLTAVKALYEERLRKLEEKVYGRRGKVDGAGTGLDDLSNED